MNGKLEDSRDTRMRPLAAPIAVAIASLTMPWQTHAAADCATSTCDICVESTELRTVTGSESANCIDIESGGLLSIDPSSANATLSLGSGASALTSTVDGTLRLLTDTDGSNVATVSFVTVSHTVAGTGNISGQDDGAKIKCDGVTLTSGVRIEGQMVVQDGASAGTFQNNGAVIANAAGGTLDIQATTIGDTSGSGRWQVTVSGAELRFLSEPAAGFSLSGSFAVSGGTLRAGGDLGGGDDIDVCTSGSLTHTGGDIVAGVNDSFCFQCSCP